MAIPVITIDGPSGSGKGTIAQLLAKKLGWHFLDSGALYRVVALAVLKSKTNPDDNTALQNLIAQLNIRTEIATPGTDATIFLNNKNITEDIRSEACSQMASITSAIPLVRVALLERQRVMRQAPGLVADGRDMGTVVFPDANIKFYFVASAEERAKRRFNQLKQKGNCVSLPEILHDLQVRDERDANRVISPAKPAEDVISIDTTHLDVQGVFESVLQIVHNRGF